MQDVTALIGISIAIAIGAASPGPSFVLVARTAVASSRSAGLFTALGMGAGGLIFACLSLLGLHSVLMAVPSLYIALKCAGGLYLAYLGFKIWRGASEPLVEAALPEGSSCQSPSRFLVLGLATQLSNPKTAIVYASVFAAFLPSTSTVAFDIYLVGLVFAIEAGWYSLVAVALSTERPRRAYLCYKAWFDRAAGGIMLMLGMKLISSARA